ncbi:MAG: hypothetical protein QN229_04275 [Desulfurococcaceae archaeon TW002]
MSTSLSDLEKRMLDIIEDLLNSCRDLCSKESFIGLLSFKENTFYKDCEYCIIKTFLDSVNAPTYSLITIDGKYLEYVVLGDYVAEVSEEYIQFIHLDNVTEYVRDLVEFNVVDEDSANELISWLPNLHKR